MGSNESVDDYITRGRNIVSSASGLGHKFSVREITYRILLEELI